MIQIPFSQEMLEESLVKAKELGSLNKSITEGAGNRVGILGELALSWFIGAEPICFGSNILKYKFDLMKGDTRIEVKSKRRTMDPRPHYDASVADTSMHQKPDYYAFLSFTFGKVYKEDKIRAYSGLKKIWLCGFISLEDFLKKSRTVKAGEVDPDNRFVCHVKMRNIRYKDLDKEIKSCYKNGAN